MQKHSIKYWLVLNTIAFLSSASVVGQSLFPFHGDTTAYFPKHELYGDDWIGLSLKKRLKMYNEPSLADVYTGLEVVRLTKAGWYDPENYIIRIERTKNRFKLVVKKLHRIYTTTEIAQDTVVTHFTMYEQIEYDSVNASYELASYTVFYLANPEDDPHPYRDSLVENSRNYINPVKCINEKKTYKGNWTHLMKLFKQNGFFEMAPTREEWRMDGHDLLLEFHNQKGYYFVNRFLEGEPEFQEIVEYVHQLAEPLMKECPSDQEAINYFNECLSIKQQRALSELESVSNDFIRLNYPKTELFEGYKLFLNDVSEIGKSFRLTDSSSVIRTNALIKAAFGDHYDERQASFLQWSKLNSCLLKASNNEYIDMYTQSKFYSDEIEPDFVAMDLKANELNPGNGLIKTIFLTEVVFRYLYLKTVM